MASESVNRFARFFCIHGAHHRQKEGFREWNSAFILITRRLVIPVCGCSICLSIDNERFVWPGLKYYGNCYREFQCLRYI